MSGNELVSMVLIGVGATLATDVWAAARKRLLAVPLPNYGLVGRWIAHMAHGKFRHDSIAAAPKVRGEAAIGWAAHFAIGIGFACLLPVLCGREWIRVPTFVPAVLVGIASVAAPFFVMQPGMGTGIAASRSPKPHAARLQSVITHGVFGAGLYATAVIINYWTVRTG